jgi:gamma-glutamyl:cysteine ligase YbdK (ATP-grasp superfamily)
MKSKIGLELELNIIDRAGNLSNKADEVLENPKGNSYIIGELSQAMVEVIGPPSDDVSKVGSDFAKNLFILDEIVKDYGLMLVPSSTVGNDANPISNDSKRIRGMRKRKVLGNQLRELEHHICGTHIHIDHLSTPEKTFKQYLTFQAMDSLFTLMSSTPFFLGSNTKKDYRVDVYRNIIFKDFPLQGQLIDYPSSMENIFQRRKIGFEQWISKDKYNGNDGFKPEDTCWGPIRLCKRTVESRCADANLFSRVLNLAVVYQAISHYIEEENPEIVINQDKNTSEKKYFNPKNKKLVIPNYQVLKEYESDGITQGLASDRLHTYVSNIISTSKPYIKDSDITFIQPFLESLEKKSTFSDDIINYARKNKLEENHILKDSAAKDVRHYIATEYHKDLELMGKKLGI